MREKLDADLFFKDYYSTGDLVSSSHSTTIVPFQAPLFTGGKQNFGVPSNCLSSASTLQKQKELGRYLDEIRLRITDGVTVGYRISTLYNDRTAVWEL